MVGMGGRVALFLLEVTNRVPAGNKIWKNQWQVGTWPRFVMPCREEKDAQAA